LNFWPLTNLPLHFAAAITQGKKDEDSPNVVSAGTRTKADPDEDIGDDERSVNTWVIAKEDMRAWAPHRLEGTWENDDGVRFVTIVIALTGGTMTDDDEGISVELINGGTELMIAEQWCKEMVSIDTFYRSFAKADDETQDEFTQRRFAMKKAYRLHMTANNGVPGPAQAIYTHTLPFPVNPTSMKVSYHGSESGTRLCHIDLAERRKITKRKVEMMSDKQNGLVPNEATVKTMKYTAGGLHSSGSRL